MIQGSAEWHQSRLGKVTASRVADVMARTKSGPAASRTNYMMELLCQRLTGTWEEGYTTAAMQRGIDLEPVARSAYEVETGLMVVEVGLIDHPHIENFAASPDGLVETAGMIEIKCPNTAQHVEFICSNTPPTKYQWQMLAQMACAEREWVDFVSFDDRMPEELQYACFRFYRDDKRIAEMEKEVRAFLDELAELEHDMRERMKGKAA